MRSHCPFFDSQPFRRAYKDGSPGCAKAGHTVRGGITDADLRPGCGPGGTPLPGALSNESGGYENADQAADFGISSNARVSVSRPDLLDEDVSCVAGWLIVCGCRPEHDANLSASIGLSESGNRQIGRGVDRDCSAGSLSTSRADSDGIPRDGTGNCLNGDL